MQSESLAGAPGLAWPAGIQAQFIDIDGYPIAYVEAGTGFPALILVHGSVSDYRAWTNQLSAFSIGYRTIAVSLRHCYPERWDGRGSDFSVGRHADDLAMFIHGKRLGAVHLVAHSRGGAVALDLALRRPELVRTLVLADPGGLEGLLPDTLEGQRMAGETARMFARLRDDLATRDATAAAREFVDALGGPGTWIGRTREQQQLVLDNIHTGPACEQRPRFTQAQISSVAVPILLVTGAASPARYAAILAAMKKANPKVSGIVSIENAAHAMNRENPTAFNSAVLDFLARH